MTNTQILAVAILVVWAISSYQVYTRISTSRWMSKAFISAIVGVFYVGGGVCIMWSLYVLCSMAFVPVN